MEVIIHGILILVDEVIAVEVVNVAVVIVIDAVGPAARAGVANGVLDQRREDIGAVDAPVAIDVGNFVIALILRIVEIAESNQAVAIDVDEILPTTGRNFGLIDLDVLVKVGMVVIDAGIDNPNDYG